MEPEKSNEDVLNWAYRYSPNLVTIAALVGVLVILIYSIKLIFELIQGKLKKSQSPVALSHQETPHN